LSGENDLDRILVYAGLLKANRNRMSKMLYSV